MDLESPKLITLADIFRLRNRVAIYYIGVLVVLTATLIWGMNVPAAPSGTPTCSNVEGTMTQVLLGGTSACFDETVWRLLFIGVFIGVGRWLATASSGEKNYGGLLKAIFSPNGNESPVLLELIYIWFLLATAATTPFYSVHGFLIGMLFRICRNSILAGIMNYVLIHGIKVKKLVIFRGAGVTNLDEYLREIVAQFSNGLPVYQAIAFLIAFYVGKALLGG